MAVNSAKSTAVAQCLVRANLLDKKTALEAVKATKANDSSLVQYIVAENLAPADKIAQCLSREFGMPLLDLSAFDSEDLPQNLLKEDVAAKLHCLPLALKGNRLYVAISDPSNLSILSQLRFQTGSNALPVLVAEDQLAGHLTAEKPKDNLTIDSMDDIDDADLDAISISATHDDDDDEAKHRERNNQQHAAEQDAPIVRFVNKIILDAINSNASDIHFEPYEGEYRIRYRRDGVLVEVSRPPVKMAKRLAARLKIMADLDISEKRVPQDGRFKMKLSKKRAVSFRVNTCPTLFGEKVVLRILDPTMATIGIDKLGFEKKQKEIFEKTITRSQGMILVTGPTGSGKTVTLYTALNILNTEEVNISTIEEPVEIYLGGINQVNVNNKSGLDFAAALRAFLRQDPDIIMVGEIRDSETAEISMKAAQTGHLVLSTLHTNSAAETLTRLINIDVAPFNIATTVNLVIAQRLIRKLCDKCKKPEDLSEKELLAQGFLKKELDEVKIYQAIGCKNCLNGYKGRIGIYEVLPITEAIGQIIMSNGSSIDIAERAKKEGMVTLRRAALLKVKRGLSSLEEINRITHE